ncbi:MAG: hypothetical protein RLZZ440_97 [Planctomycetota bacterium]
MTITTTPPDRIELAAGTTMVVFRRAGDRWEHELRLAGGRVWRSVEGPAHGADPRWPASPAIVEVSRVATAGATVLLGVGRAGRSHYSISVAAAEHEPDTLLFDVACRIQEPAGWLGSTYADPASGEACRLQAGPSLPPPATIRWAYTVGPGGILPRA